MLGGVADRESPAAVLFTDSVTLVMLYWRTEDVAVGRPSGFGGISDVNVFCTMTAARPAGNERPQGNHSGNSVLYFF